jgi:hypothetical protein
MSSLEQTLGTGLRFGERRRSCRESRGCLGRATESVRGPRRRQEQRRRERRSLGLPDFEERACVG